MVDYFESAAQLRELSGNRVEAVSTRHNDFPRVSLVQRVNGGACQHLEQDFIAGTTRRIPSTRLSRSKHPERHASGVQQFRQRGSGLFRTIIVRTRASDPQHVLHVIGRLNILSDHRYLEVQVLRPLQTLASRLVIRISLLFHPAERARQVARECRLHQHLVASQIQDVVNVFNIDRALIHTRTTHRAVPQDTLVNDVGNEWPVGVAHPKRTGRTRG